MSLIFNKIENRRIFTNDFSPFIRNNEITFPERQEIAVIYGPNGTGKTSLIKALGDANETSIDFLLDDVSYQSGNGVFHIINDQNGRNVISGETRDFFLGDNIRREFELQDQISIDRERLISSLIMSLKNNFKISAANSPMIAFITNTTLRDFIKDCVNSKSKGKNFTNESIVNLLNSLSNEYLPEYETEKFNFFCSDCADKKSIIKQLQQLVGLELTPNTHVYEIEENTEAINILSRFHKDICIVCDNDDFDRESLLARKTSNRETTLNELDERIRNVLDYIIGLVPNEDPFNIKNKLLEAISDGDISKIISLCSEINAYQNIYYVLLKKYIIEIFTENELASHFIEYQRIISERTDINEEDYLYIQEIISNSMDKPLTVERDENRSLRIYLSNQEFLNKDRDELPLSTGEQNFLSLTFEFLKAKNSPCPIVVIDDPISSFDSIYKNKVVYAIVKMLQHKKRIVLTHNIDLIRLLNCQHNHCFKLYLFNNTENEMNGFIPLNNGEQEMLISLEKLLVAFRTSLPQHVQNRELFLISLIPFMRGYANIINKTELYNQLTQVMHGYKTEKVDIAKVYEELFGLHREYLPESYEITVADILAKNVDGIHIVDSVRFPLLDRTLRHSFIYLFLRLMVEKALVEKFEIDTERNKQLGQIISAAYPNETEVEQIRNRIRLTSKKTLINEFNHFEGNLSIFQPAIDITDQSLGKERNDLVTFVNNL